jgi:tetratricopeptide (TPR) repeat protein
VSFPRKRTPEPRRVRPSLDARFRGHDATFGLEDVVESVFAIPESPGIAHMAGLTAAPQSLGLAMSAYRTGNLAEAERLCRKIIGSDPRSFDAVHLLAVVQAALGKREKAIASYDRAISLRSNDAALFSNRGVVLKDMRRFDEALASFDRALAIEPRLAGAHANRGNTFRALERWDEALESYGRALAIRPDDSRTIHNRGVALYRAGRFDEALASLDRAIALRADLAEAWADRGIVLRATKRFKEALASFDKAIALAPHMAELHDLRANVLVKLKRFEQALASCDHAIALKPESAEPHADRGLILHAMKRLEEALASCDRAIKRKPDFAEAHFIRGHVLHELKRPEEAIVSYESAIRIDPGHKNANGHLSHTLLLLGRFERGWKQYEWRKKLDEPMGNASFSQPVWSGEEPIDGATILIHAEQGLGDTLQFCRYAKRVQALGARVIFSVQAPLVRLLEQLDPGLEIIGAGSPSAAFDYHCALMSLPLAFGTNGSNMPAEVRYLCAEPPRAEKWKRRVGDTGLKVGVCWSGLTIGAGTEKSFLLNDLYSISKLPGVRLMSLQKGEGADQLKSAPEGMHIESFGDELDAGTDAFLDTAAIMESLDLIITADTSVAHLAGALGRPTWVALKQIPDWRWGLEGDATPWYPSMRLFRQKSRDDWKNVFAQMERELSVAGQQTSL